MSGVFIIGVGLVPVTKSTETLGRHLAAEAVRRALADAAVVARPDGLFCGNMMSGILCQQQQLGALIADAAGLRGIEAATVEAACGSGAAAARWGTMAIGSGAHRAVVVCGVEKMTHTPREETTRALATASDWQLEGRVGESFISLNARLMAAYMEAWGVTAEDFAPLAIVAHGNACDSPHALFHKPIGLEDYLASREIVPPVRLFDASPVCNGAAALVLADEEVARAARAAGRPVVRVLGGAMATDSLGLDGRSSLLRLEGVIRSTALALEQARITLDDVDLFELHDAYTVISALSLEGAGFAPPGEGLRFVRDAGVGRDGKLPISTMGGLKARGHPVGATGVYQLVEAVLQLTGRAGACQVPRAEVAMTQNIGGTGATVVTHLLRREA